MSSSIAVCKLPVSVQNTSAHLLTLVYGQHKEEFCRYVYEDSVVEILNIMMLCWCFRKTCSELIFLQSN